MTPLPHIFDIDELNLSFNQFYGLLRQQLVYLFWAFD